MGNDAENRSANLKFIAYILGVAVLGVAWFLNNRRIDAASKEYARQPVNRVRLAIEVTDMPQLLLLLKANPELGNTKTPFGWTPLHRAAQYDNNELAVLLLANKADVNAKDNLGDTPLHYAAWKGHKEIAVLLLDNKADINVKDSEGETPLQWAIKFDQKETANLLRQHGAKE